METKSNHRLSVPAVGLLCLAASCASTHETRAVESFGDIDAGAQQADHRETEEQLQECPAAAKFTAARSSKEETLNVLYRLGHEAHHLRDIVEKMALAEDLPFHIENALSFARTFDHGQMLAEGEMDMAAESTRVVFSAEFESFSGGHGGFGPAALDGAACVAVTVDSGTVHADRPSYKLRVFGKAGLASGGALVAAPVVAFDYEVRSTPDGPIRQGSIGAYALFEDRSADPRLGLLLPAK